MMEDFLDTLDAEEAEELTRDVNAAKAKVLDRRAAKKQAALVVAYRAEMEAARGKGWLLTQIREKYQKLGCDTGKVDFS